MPTSFLSLPAELRNEIYMYLLVRREPIDPWNGYNGLVPNILSTNTKILHEARSLLYGENYFDFSGRRSLLVSQFLDDIGFVNASHILCIRIDFPRILGLNDNANLDSLDIPKRTQCYCTNLNKVIVASESTTELEYHLDSLDSPNIYAKVLAMIDAHFREISSLQDIVVEVYEEGPSSEIRKKMKSHGWILNMVEEPVEEVEWNSHTSWDNFEDDEYLCLCD
ncbi:hypothetical protein N7455_010837 [Penicillium solitum]|uniref:uncharacterized protein n=1 Tax=Penicillium solitum TaxID=60172 RepID=UPI00181BC2F7|nr:hypothetical protein HAV15_000944 [Penicillium sp. str. \